MRKNHQLAYLVNEIPAAREVSYSFRNVNEYDAAVCGTARFSNTYFQNVLLEWNAFEKDVLESNMLDEFKRKLLVKIRPDRKPVFEICGTSGVRCLTKLLVRFSPLNEHKFRYNFEPVSPICRCNTGIEDNENFLLHCPMYNQMRNDLFYQLSEIPGLSLIILTLRPYVNYFFLVIHVSTISNIRTFHWNEKATLPHIQSIL